MKNEFVSVRYAAGTSVQGSAFRNTRAGAVKRSHVRIQRAMVLAVLTISVLFTVLFLRAGAETNDASHSSYKYYTTVTAEEGDSLYSIGMRYYDGSGDQSTDDYIREVRRINHICEDDPIYAGEVLVFPYYSDVKKN